MSEDELVRVEKMSGVTHYMYAGDYIAKPRWVFLTIAIGSTWFIKSTVI